MERYFFVPKLESDVPQACAATPSQSRRNDVDEEDGCRDSASENDAATSQSKPEGESIMKF